MERDHAHRVTFCSIRTLVRNGKVKGAGIELTETKSGDTDQERTRGEPLSHRPMNPVI